MTLGELSRAGGLSAGFTATAVLGLLVFTLFASAFGSEHSSVTLRALLTREPRRLRLQVGSGWDSRCSPRPSSPSSLPSPGG